VRRILHVDLNAFYASVEQAKNESLKGKAIAVAGDKDKRNGIILTASYEARKFGIRTGMTIQEARNLCPNIIFIKPHFKDYMDYSNRVMDILRDYTPDVEVFSIDEAWLDVTGCERLFGDAKKIANTIRERIKRELKITASIGVSYCKLMAKMASDLKKPDATTVIEPEDIKEKIWPLPVEDLFGVGRRMKRKLNNIGIFTIGDLANMPMSVIEDKFGKVGRYLWKFANGIDDSKVNPNSRQIKGIGNSITTPRNVVNMEEASEVLMALSESVGKRLREHGLEGSIIEIIIRYSDFTTIIRQRKLRFFTDITYEIYKSSMKLFNETWDGRPLRLLGVRITGLRRCDDFKQISIFDDDKKIKYEKIDKCIDLIREKYGYNSVIRAKLLTNESYRMIKIVSDEEWIPMQSYNKGGGQI